MLILCEVVEVEQSYIGLTGLASAVFETTSSLVSAPGAYGALVFPGLLRIDASWDVIFEPVLVDMTTERDRRQSAHPVEMLLVEMFTQE